jgi:hypothetical protein
MLLAALEPGLSGVATFECRSCGYVIATVVPSDPMRSDVLGWLASELRPPT